MIYVLLICLAGCAGMIAVTLVKPKVTVFGVSFGTYWLVALLSAALLTVFGFIGFGEIWAGLTTSNSINPIKILVLFISMAVLSIFLDEMGFFRFLANAVVKKTGKSQIKLFTAFYLTVSVLTVFTSNDIIILTFTPFICYIAKRTGVNPVPYLVSEFVAANTCSILLIIGNPTNIYLATANGIEFIEYLKVMALPTLFAFVTAYCVMLPLFYKALKKPMCSEVESIVIEHKPLLLSALIILSACTVLLAISSYLGFEMWLISLCSAVLLSLIAIIYCVLKRKKPRELLKTFRRAPWELIPFVVSMFVMVLAFDKYGITTEIANLLSGGNIILTYGFSSVLAANLINNIPMSVLFSSVLQFLSPAVINQGIFAVIIGSNIGAFLTPIGALAGIMWLQILKDNGVEFRFLRFVKYGVIIGVPTLLAALFGLFVVL